MLNQEYHQRTGPSYRLMVVAMLLAQFKSMKWSHAVKVDRVVLSLTSATLTRMSAQEVMHQANEVC